jgi:hypothetical protein
MFISKAEKEDLFYRIGLLEQRINDLTAKVVILSKFPEARADKGRQGRTWNPEQRAKASEQMKQFWANKKEKA